VYDFDGEHDPPSSCGTWKADAKRCSSAEVPRRLLYILTSRRGARLRRQGVVHRDLKPQRDDRQGGTRSHRPRDRACRGGEKDLTHRPHDRDARLHGARAGAGRQVDKAADIYSLGVMAFEILTGRQPRERERFEILSRT
jgi:serine/threonine protein kinase